MPPGTDRPALRNPGWEHDRKLAQEHATTLAATLLTVIPARALAVAWHAHTATGGHRSGALQWLKDAGVLIGIIAVLKHVLRDLWAAGWQLGVDSGTILTGVKLADAEQALEQMLAEAESGRVDGPALTRLTQLADILEDEDTGGLTVAALADEIELEIGSETSALLLTQTEVTWSMAEGMLGVFYQAGSLTVMWLTADDDRVCVPCMTNEAEGFIPIGASFPGSGNSQPPAHPRCRCALIPGDIGGWSLPIHL